MTDSAARRAKNEKLFREVNEKLRELNAEFEKFTGGTAGFICECDNINCNSAVSVSADDYARIRDNRDWFIVKRGHQAPSELERVVENARDYIVVEKTEFAKRLDLTQELGRGGER